MGYLFTQEIKLMMFSYGDVQNPCTEAAKYIERVIKAQIYDLLERANRIRFIHKGKIIELEDILFVVRRNRCKLMRMINFINIRNIKKSISCEEFPIEEELQFNWVIQSNEDFVDHEQQLKLKRINDLTLGMSKEKYLEFTEARQASFTYKKMKKFKLFIRPYKVKDDAVEILGYICSEIVYLLVFKTLERKNKFSPLNSDELKKTCWELAIENDHLY